MKNYLLLILSLLLASNSTLASVTVNTGEHEDFTRLAINIPKGADWNINKRPNGIAIEVIDQEFAALDNFFRIIPKDRIGSAELINNDQQLMLTLNCNCEYRTEIWQEIWLVVDIYDPLPTSTLVATNESFDRILPELRQQQVINLPLVFNENNGKSSENEAHLPELQISSVASVIDYDRYIQGGLNRAAMQGLLTLKEQSSAGVSNHIDANQARSLPLQPGVLSHTSLEDQEPVSATIATDQSSLECVSDEELNISSWGDPDEFSRQISERRRLIFDSAGAQDGNAIIELAKAYAYFGFGREAMYVLDMQSSQDDKSQIIKTISQIIDGDHVSDNKFSEQLDCQTDIVFWVYMSDAQKPILSESKFEDVILAYKKLPRNLQSHFNTRLSERLIDAGEIQLADDILNNQNEKSDTHVLSARIEIDRGNSASALKILDELVTFDQRSTPEALLRFISIKLENDSPIDHSIIETLEAMQIEFRNQAIAADMIKAHISILIHNQNFSEAIIRLRNINNKISTQTRMTLMNDTFFAALASDDTASFLDIAFAEELKNQEEGLKLAYANRLRELGFDDHAQLIFSNSETLRSDQIDFPQGSQNTLTQNFENASPNIDQLQSTDSPEFDYLSALKKSQDLRSNLDQIFEN